MEAKSFFPSFFLFLFFLGVLFSLSIVGSYCHGTVFRFKLIYFSGYARIEHSTR